MANPKAVIALLILGLTYAHAYANLNATPQQLADYETQCPKFRSNTPDKVPMYHWMDMVNGVRWAMQGYVDQGEIDFLAATDTGQAAGGGLYLASDDSSSSGFGPFPTKFQVPGNACKQDSSVDRAVFGRTLNRQELKDLGRQLPNGLLVQVPGRTNWFVTTSSVLAKEVTVLEGKIQWNNALRQVGGRWGFESSTDKFLDLYLTDQSKPYYGAAAWLRSFMNLMSYMDGISLVRAINVNPGNPGAEFEPSRFPPYDNARTTLHRWGTDTKVANVPTPPAEITAFSSASGISGANCLAALTTLFNMVAGLPAGTPLEYRTEGVRAGGTKIIGGEGFFQVTTAQIKQMKSNKFITVALPPDGTPGYAAYYYPDAFHFEKPAAAGLLSDKLVATLRATQPGVLMGDTALRQQLNTEIVTELMNGVFKAYDKYRTSSGSNYDVNMAIDLVSIHPWGDLNGRTTRFFQEMIMIMGNRNQYTTSPSYIGDFDTVMDPSVYYQFVRKSGELAQELRVAMVKQFVEACAAKKSPDHFALPEWDNWSMSLSVFGLTQAVKFTQADFDMIKSRNFIDLVEKYIPNFKNNYIKVDPNALPPSSPRDTSDGSQRAVYVTVAGIVGVCVVAIAIAAVMLQRRRREQAATANDVATADNADYVQL